MNMHSAGQEPSVACHECGGPGQISEPVNGSDVCPKCDGKGRIPLSQFDGTPHRMFGLEEHLCAEGWCFPVTQLVEKALSDQLIRIDDSHNHLVIRLELDYVDYGRMEDLLREGVQARQDRVAALELYKSANQGRMATRENPLSVSDIDYAIRRAQEDHRAAIALTHRVSRPKP